MIFFIWKYVHTISFVFFTNCPSGCPTKSNVHFLCPNHLNLAVSVYKETKYQKSDWPSVPKGFFWGFSKGKSAKIEAKIRNFKICSKLEGNQFLLPTIPKMVGKVSAPFLNLWVLDYLKMKWFLFIISLFVFMQRQSYTFYLEKVFCKSWWEELRECSPLVCNCGNQNLLNTHQPMSFVFFPRIQGKSFMPRQN